MKIYTHICCDVLFKAISQPIFIIEVLKYTQGIYVTVYILKNYSQTEYTFFFRQTTRMTKSYYKNRAPIVNVMATHRPPVHYTLTVRAYLQ